MEKIKQEIMECHPDDTNKEAPLLLQYLKDKKIGDLHGSEIQRIEVKQEIRRHRFQDEEAILLAYKFFTSKGEEIIYGFFSSKSNSTRLLHKKTFLFKLMEYNFPNKRIRITKPLGFYPEINLLLREEAEGDTAFEMIKEKKQRKKIIKGVARWIARFHNLKPEKNVFTKVSGIQKNNSEYFIKAMQQYVPSEASRIKNILLSIDKITENIQQTKLVHGDFQTQNIIYNKKENTTFVIDFDYSGIGDPLYDIGSFLLQFDYHISESFSEKKIIKLKKYFLKCYFKNNKQLKQGFKRVNAYQAKIAIQRVIWTLGYINDPKNSQFNNKEQKKTIDNLIKKAEECLVERKEINLTNYFYKVLPSKFRF